MADLAVTRARSTRRSGDPPVADAGGAALGATPKPRASARLIAAAMAVAVLLLWEIAGRMGLTNTAFFPTPVAIARALGESIRRGELPPHFFATLSRVAAGLALGAGTGLILGLTLGSFQRARAVVDPFVAALHPIPKLALLPLLLLALGLGEWPRIVVIAAASFFPMLLNTIAGVRQINAVHFDVARVYGASRLQLLTRVIFPGSVPMVLTGLRLAANVAFLSAIAVEMVYAQHGLGALIWLAWQVLRVDTLYATLTVIAIVGIALNAALQWTARRGAPWLSERELTV
ncbi:MAG: ABC transporter permease [Gemmatimonadaceae bacterium]